MKRRSLILILITGCLLPALVSAQTTATPKPLGTFGHWSAYTANEGDQQTCYMLLISHPMTPLPPVKSKKKKKLPKRGAIYLMITHRPAESSKDVVSYTAGYNFKPASDVDIQIGKSKFSLFTQSDTAWSRDAATDHALAAAIRNGKSMVVTGEAAYGATVSDTLDIKGAAEAYRAIGKACGVEVPPEPALMQKKKMKTKG